MRFALFVVGALLVAALVGVVVAGGIGVVHEAYAVAAATQVPPPISVMR